MDLDSSSDKPGLREFSQLIRIQERLLVKLQAVLDELHAPTTLNLLKALKKQTGRMVGEEIGEITGPFQTGNTRRTETDGKIRSIRRRQAVSLHKCAEPRHC